jgi:hypothetical protein
MTGPEQFWSLHFDACIKCGTAQVPHKSRGMCRNCYQKWHIATKEEKHLRPFTKRCTLSRWARDYSACIICNRADIKHSCRGYCNRCYRQLRAIDATPPIRIKRPVITKPKPPTVSPIGEVYIGTRIVLQAAFGALVCGSVVRSESRYLRIKDDATRNVLEINPKAILAKGDSGKVTICNQSAWGDLGSQARRWATNKLHEVAA